MVRFSIKPGDQTDETERANLNLVNKTELKGEYQSFSLFLLDVLRNFKRRGLLTDLNQQEIKEMLASQNLK